MNRFDAAAEWERRKGARTKWLTDPPDAFEYCMMCRDDNISPDRCRLTARHVGFVFCLHDNDPHVLRKLYASIPRLGPGAHTITDQSWFRDGYLRFALSDFLGRTVKAAAFVLAKIERDTLRPYEPLIERLVRVDYQLGEHEMPLTGKQLLKLVTRAMKHEPEI